MKKILMSLALLGTFAAMTAKGDSYLYWMVDNAKSGDGTTPEFSFAQLSAVKTVGGSVVQTVDLGGSDAIGSSTERNLAVAPGSLQGFDVSQFSGPEWSFIVELYNGVSADQWVSQSVLSYSQASAGIYEHLAPFSDGVAKFQTFNIPEPTSGLLMLFGLCGLALKRKRV